METILMKHPVPSIAILLVLFCISWLSASSQTSSHSVDAEGHQSWQHAVFYEIYSPCFPSPQVDCGYDVSDYENIDPMYGTLADFDMLTSEAKKRGIHVILDF